MNKNACILRAVASLILAFFIIAGLIGMIYCFLNAGKFYRQTDKTWQYVLGIVSILTGGFFGFLGHSLLNCIADMTDNSEQTAEMAIELKRENEALIKYTKEILKCYKYANGIVDKEELIEKDNDSKKRTEKTEQTESKRVDEGSWVYDDNDNLKWIKHNNDEK